MKICFLGLDNLPVLSPEHREHYVGGESVQQTLLARALTARGHEVSMVTADYGQADGAVWDGIRVHKAYRPEAGLPVLRFVHPRWSGLWSALARADAQLYYTSCAGMQVALLALFCARRGRRFVFRSASDSDCDRSKLLIRYARDRWLYAWGLRRADAILVQSAAQAASLARHFGLASRVTGMLVEPASAEQERDIDVLWVANIRRLKRPDRMLALAGELPEAAIHMVGGPLRGEEALYGEVRRAASLRPNLVFHGRLSYHDARAVRARPAAGQHLGGRGVPERLSAGLDQRRSGHQLPRPRRCHRPQWAGRDSRVAAADARRGAATAPRPERARGGGRALPRLHGARVRRGPDPRALSRRLRGAAP